MIALFIAARILAGTLGQPLADSYLVAPRFEHPVATNCEVDDERCLREYDRRAIDLAIMARDFSVCDLAVDEKTCKQALALAEGDIRRKYDPCTWVRSIRDGYATITRFGSPYSIVVPARPGWRERHFVGECRPQQQLTAQDRVRRRWR